MKSPPATPSPRALPGRVFLSRFAVHLASWRLHLLLPGWACLFTTAALEWAEPGRQDPAAGLEFPGWGPSSLWLAAAGLGFISVSNHLLNLVADAAGDALNQKNLFWQGRVSRHLMWLQAGGAALAGVGLLVAMDFDFFWPALACLTLGLAYSLTPPGLAKNWAGGVAAHILGYGLLVPWLAVLAVDPESDPGSAWIRAMPASTFLIPLVGSAYLLTTVLDIAGDGATGKKTWAVRWGERSAVLTAISLLAVGAAWLWHSPLATPRSTPAPAVIMVLAGVLLATGKAGSRTRRSSLILVVHLTVALVAWPALAIWPALILPALGWWGLARLVLTRIGHEGA